jgi:hypothetical protein
MSAATHDLNCKLASNRDVLFKQENAERVPNNTVAVAMELQVAGAPAFSGMEIGGRFT